MSQNTPLLTLSTKATAALIALRFVTATGATATAAGNALGVSRSDAAIGEYAPVDVLGTTQVTAGGAITAGAATAFPPARSWLAPHLVAPLPLTVT